MSRSEPVPTGPDRSFWEQVGGRSTFERLVCGFCAGVATDEVMRPMYEDDLKPVTGRLTGFLEQYWRGPTSCSEERGRPRLRLRHHPSR